MTSVFGLMPTGRKARWLGCALVLLGSAPSLAAVTASPPHRTLPAPSVHKLTFSADPTNSELLQTGLFTEPLAPVAATNAAENRDLARAVLAYRDAVSATGGADAVTPLLDFLDRHPNSAWKPALLLNLGLIYRQTGHYSKALAIWQHGWADTQRLTSPEGIAVANEMVANLSQAEAYLGRTELLRPLLASLTGRSVGGTAAQFLTNSRTGLYRMTVEPQNSFRCGPLALLKILRYSDPHPSATAVQFLEMQSPSTDHGLSLTAVEEYAKQAGMKYQMAYRSPGAPLILPAVANWKVGHYAAIVDRDANGHYVVQDTTFGEDLRASAQTIDEESSGYFLVPAGTLPKGWRSVSASEGSAVWGRGDGGMTHDQTDTGSQAQTSGGNCKKGGCTTATVELEVTGLQLDDHPVGYTPPVGPAVRFQMVYSHRDTLQPGTFSYTNFGPKWTFNWLSYITDDVHSAASATVYMRGGGSEPFTFSSTTATTSYAGPFSQTILTRTVNGSGTSTSFTLTHPDGSFEQYALADGSLFFMTAVGDKSGNIVTLTYDGSMRITQITDAIGQVTTLTYGLTGSPLVVTQITDPFGRSASFTYNGSGLLESITDVLGITSSYTYGQGTDPDFINTLTTPYGSTTFTYGDSSTDSSLGQERFVKTVDPLGRTSYVEYDWTEGYTSSAIPSDVNPNSDGSLYNSALIPTGMCTFDYYMQNRNTFIFDANQYQLATAGGSLNYADAKVVHWLHTGDGSAVSRVKESEKEPLENRVWYNYPNQSNCDDIPVTIGGTVTNGASSEPTAIGRVLDNGNTQLQTYSYNAEGNVTVATDPVGRQTTYIYAANGIDRLTTSNTTSGSQLLETRTYNSQHLPLTVKGANGMTVRYQYNSTGQLTRYTDQQGQATALTYDPNGYLKNTRGPISGAQYSYGYDNVGRIAAITDPAGYIVRFSYDAADRPTGATYPDGTVTHIGYTLLDKTSSTDRLGQTTQYTYDADRELTQTTDALNQTVQLGYNPAGKLDLITDANSNPTTLTLDAQSRLTQKRYADGTTLTISYESSISEIASVADALSQTTTFTYNPDNTIASIVYSANQPTPSVSFTYDPAYQRPVSMNDGNGNTSYIYYPVSSLGANLLESITSPVAGQSSSDTLTYSYDALNRIIGYNIDGQAQSISYDALSRITSDTNALDAFAYSYSDATPRVTGITSTHGPNFAMSYFGPTGDELIKQISVSAHGGGSLAQFGYSYNSDDIVAAFTNTAPSESIGYSYDMTNRLTSALIGSGTPQYQYGYDPASNLSSITTNGSTQNYTFNSTNSISSGVSSTYDSNGSPTTLGSNTYTWDGANRLISFTGPSGTSSSFTYDGLGRLVRVVDSVGGSVVADHSYFWCGQVRCLAHDNTQSGSPVSTQYFSQGATVSGTPSYYVQDQLGSVRQLITSAGNVAAEYDYDSYGNRTVVSGTTVSDIGYAGYFYHGASGLNFTMYRAYDSSHARWLNRDPIGEDGGINLYAYTGGNPASFIDPYGLFLVLPANSAPFYQAAAYLQQDPGMAQIIQDLENSATEYDIQYINNGNDQYDPGTHTISWDPNSALCTTAGGRQTPALGLGHEMAHADIDVWTSLEELWDELIGTYDVPGYDNVEEQRVITGPETTAAQTLGEDIRTDHGGTPYTVPTPISR